MTEQELKIMLASAYCLNSLPNGCELANDLIAYVFKLCFDIDIRLLGSYCLQHGNKALSEITDILDNKTNYKRSALQ